MHTSLGHLIRPICLRTRRSLSLSSCSSPVWPSLPEGWGGTNTTLHKCVPPQYLPLLPNLKKNGDENVFSILGVHTVPGSLNRFMVRLFLKACLWQLSNSCFHSSVGWCQTPAKTRTTDGGAAREKKAEKCRGLERVWTWESQRSELHVFSHVLTQSKMQDDFDASLAFAKGKEEMRYSQSTSLIQGNHA